MADVYSAYNGAGSATVPAPVAVTGGTAKTMQVLMTGSTRSARIVEWGCDGDNNTANVPGVVELAFGTTATPATVTAYVAASDFRKYTPGSPASLLSVGTTASGYTATAEGTLASPFNIPHQMPPTSGFYIQYPQPREPVVDVSSQVRVRAKFATAVNLITNVAWEE